MSAAEIIELIKKLPPEERAEVAAFLEKREAGAVEEPPAGYATGSAERIVRHVSDEDFEKALPGIFGRHRELFRRLAQ